MNTLIETRQQRNTDLRTLATEIARRRETNLDFVAPTRGLRIANGEPFGRNGLVMLAEGLEFPDGVPTLTRHAQQQVASTLDIPLGYWDRLMSSHLENLLVENVNTIFDAEPRTRLVRTQRPGSGREMRAFLSDRYQVLDHWDVIEATHGALQSLRTPANIVTAEVTDRKLFFQVIFPALEGEIKVGDVVQAGITVGNSEIGDGSLFVEPFILRLVCTNGLRVPASFSDARLRKNHVGKRLTAETAASVVFASDTQAARNRALLLEMRDTVRTIASNETFQGIVGALRRSTESTPVKHPEAAADTVAKTFVLTQPERSSFLENLIAGHDYSQYGVINAITALAHQADTDRAMELQRAGGRVITLNRAEWKDIAEAA